MTKEYLISLLTTNGTTKNIVVEAVDCKQANELASRRYPSYEIVRATCDEKDLRYFSTIKKMRKDQ